METNERDDREPKARLVAIGNQDTAHHIFLNSAQKTLRLVYAATAQHKFKPIVIDLNNAFLNSKNIDGDIHDSTQGQAAQ